MYICRSIYKKGEMITVKKIKEIREIKEKKIKEIREME